MTSPQVRRRPAGPGAFSLIELLVVILIIALVVAIVLPALGGARNIARRTATQQVMTAFVTAASIFERDHGRLPGVFTPEQMGSPDNRDRGMSAMENALIELTWAAAIRKYPGQSQSGPIGGVAQILRAGPERGSADRQVWLDQAKMGLATDATAVYFNPDPKYLVPQARNRGQQVGDPPHTADEGTPQLPDLVDAFGQPILLWVDNEHAGQVMGATPADVFSGQAAFAAEDSSVPARFYWNANACFLRSPALGKQGRDQGDGQRGSLIGGDWTVEYARSMAGILGHPGYPDQRRRFPTTGRGRFVLHSAGVDGVYFGRRDSGARQFPGDPASKVIDYRRTFVDDTGQPYRDENGNTTTIDLVERFDDILATGG